MVNTIDVAEGALEVMGPAADGLEQVLDMKVGVGRRGSIETWIWRSGALQ